jgi:hypothetical protein
LLRRLQPLRQRVPYRADSADTKTIKQKKHKKQKAQPIERLRLLCVSVIQSQGFIPVHGSLWILLGEQEKSLERHAGKIHCKM